MHLSIIEQPYQVILPERLRTAVVTRRVSLSDPVARVVAEMAFGMHRRDDLVTLMNATAARVADAGGVCL